MKRNFKSDSPFHSLLSPSLGSRFSLVAEIMWCPSFFFYTYPHDIVPPSRRRVVIYRRNVLLWSPSCRSGLPSPDPIFSPPLPFAHKGGGSPHELKDVPPNRSLLGFTLDQFLFLLSAGITPPFPCRERSSHSSELDGFIPFISSFSSSVFAAFLSFGNIDTPSLSGCSAGYDPSTL